MEKSWRGDVRRILHVPVLGAIGWQAGSDKRYFLVCVICIAATSLCDVANCVLADAEIAGNPVASAFGDRCHDAVLAPETTN